MWGDVTAITMESNFSPQERGDAQQLEFFERCNAEISNTLTNPMYMPV